MTYYCSFITIVSKCLKLDNFFGLAGLLQLVKQFFDGTCENFGSTCQLVTCGSFGLV